MIKLDQIKKTQTKKTTRGVSNFKVFFLFWFEKLVMYRILQYIFRWDQYHRTKNKKSSLFVTTCLTP